MNFPDMPQRVAVITSIYLKYNDDRFNLPQNGRSLHKISLFTYHTSNSNMDSVKNVEKSKRFKVNNNDEKPNLSQNGSNLSEKAQFSHGQYQKNQ